MSSATKVLSAVSFRYAIALMELAVENKKLDQVEKDLHELRSMVESSSDLTLLIRSPLVNADKRNKALGALADKAKFQDYTKNFLGLLSKNGRLPELVNIINAFDQELSKRRGEVAVSVQTAQDLTAKQKKDLQASISKSIGSEVSIKATVEPSIMGGMIVTVGSQMIDNSVVRKLERLKAAMSKESNENTVNLEEVG